MMKSSKEHSLFEIESFVTLNYFIITSDQVNASSLNRILKYKGTDPTFLNGSLCVYISLAQLFASLSDRKACGAVIGSITAEPGTVCFSIFICTNTFKRKDIQAHTFCVTKS